MKSKQNLLLVITCLFILNVGAQKEELRKGLREYDGLAYLKTSEVLLEVADSGYKSADLFQKLGNSFYYNNKMDEAVKWYDQLIRLQPESDPEYYYRYAQALKSIGRYKESDKWMQKFHLVKPGDLRGQAFVSNSNYLSRIEEISKEFEIQNLGVNTAVSDFGAVLHKGKLIFASSRKEGKIYKWNGQPFLELFKAETLDDDYGNADHYNTGVNTEYHESSPAFTPDGKWMFFTRSNYYRKRLQTDEKRVNRLKLFRMGLVEGENKGKMKSVKFNDNDYSVAHPTVNKTGTKLYFSSDMPGTYGLSDLYEATLKPDGKLSDPVNLGMAINTEGRESFPFINQKGDLFFASDGRNGLGGLDLFVVRDFERKKARNLPLNAENLGKPLNSPKDDFAYFESEETGEGFFSSNRPGGKGDDDIYRFTFKPCTVLLSGVVRDKNTGSPILGAVATLFNAQGQELQQQKVDNQGNYLFDPLSCETEYLVRAEKEDYRSLEKRFQTLKSDKKINEDIILSKDKIEIGEGTNLREALELNPIYFDLDKSYIRTDAEIELQKVIAVLKKYPNMRVNIKSHTDSRASKDYNAMLSQKRNLATMQYLVIKGGINPDRLSGWGYGESELINHCADGVDCTDEEHQQNRRSDFVILSMNN